MKTVILAVMLAFTVLITSACGGRSALPQADSNLLVDYDLPVIYHLASIVHGDNPRERTQITDNATRQTILEAIEAAMQNPMSEEDQSSFIFQSMIRSLFLPPLEFVIEDVTYSFHGIDSVLIVSQSGDSQYYHVSGRWWDWWDDADTH